MNEENRETAKQNKSYKTFLSSNRKAKYSRYSNPDNPSSYVPLFYTRKANGLAAPDLLKKTYERVDFKSVSFGNVHLSALFRHRRRSVRDKPKVI